MATASTVSNTPDFIFLQPGIIQEKPLKPSWVSRNSQPRSLHEAVQLIDWKVQWADCSISLLIRLRPTWVCQQLTLFWAEVLCWELLCTWENMAYVRCICHFYFIFSLHRSFKTCYWMEIQISLASRVSIRFVRENTDWFNILCVISLDVFQIGP